MDKFKVKAKFKPAGDPIQSLSKLMFLTEQLSATTDGV